jgi:hypothetical protein
MTDIDVDINEKTQDIPVTKRPRRQKKELYENERQEILKKLLKILDINENNKVFITDDIDKNQAKIDQILALRDDVKKFFNAGRWTFFCKKVPKPWLSLTKSILKACGKELQNTYIMKKHSTSITGKGIYIS